MDFREITTRLQLILRFEAAFVSELQGKRGLRDQQLRTRRALRSSVSLCFMLLAVVMEYKFGRAFLEQSLAAE